MMVGDDLLLDQPSYQNFDTSFSSPIVSQNKNELKKIFDDMKKYGSNFGLLIRGFFYFYSNEVYNLFFSTLSFDIYIYLNL